MKLGNGRRAFTLIEMLMVIIIIFMLSLIVFRLMKVLDNKTKVARTVYVLKQLQNALNEYKIEYGIYPPVENEVQYEYATTNGWTPWFRSFLAQHNDPTITNGESGNCFWTDRGEGVGASSEPHKPGELGYTGHPKYPEEWHLHYRYGLVAHLDKRDRGQVHWYDEDTEADDEAKNKWSMFIHPDGEEEESSLISGGGGATYDVTEEVSTVCVFSNKIDTIKDGFGNEIKYECYAPYTSYKLWADTPVGVIDSGSVGGM